MADRMMVKGEKMTPNLQIFMIILLATGAMAFLGSSPVLTAIHISHFDSEKGPELPLNDNGVTPIIDRTCAEKPVDDRPLPQITLWDACHSLGGDCNGVAMAGPTGRIKDTNPSIV